jgi:hypothetical protein
MLGRKAGGGGQSRGRRLLLGGASARVGGHSATSCCQRGRMVWKRKPASTMHVPPCASQPPTLPFSPSPQKTPRHPRLSIRQVWNRFLGAPRILIGARGSTKQGRPQSGSRNTSQVASRSGGRDGGEAGCHGKGEKRKADLDCGRGGCSMAGGEEGDVWNAPTGRCQAPVHMQTGAVLMQTGAVHMQTGSGAYADRRRSA